MSLTFTKETNMFISAKIEQKKICLLFCSEKNSKWRVYSISSSFAEPEHLRQIADKLDKLNGVLK